MIDWEKLRQYNIIAKTNLIVCLDDEADIGSANKAGIDFFFSYVFRDFYTLRRAIALGVCAARITAPLTYYMDVIKTLPIEIRVFPAHSGINLENVDDFTGLYGGWFRPEDFYQLNDITTAEFPDVPMKTEQALYRIYAENHEWSGSLNMLIKNLNVDAGVVNRMLPPEFQEARNNCKQRCQSGSNCRLCNMYIRLANPDFIKQGLDATEEYVNEEYDYLDDEDFDEI